MLTRIFVSFGALVVVVVGQAGCNQSPPSAVPADPAKQASDMVHEGDNHDGWWCNEHGVPEEVCGLCDKKLAAKFKADGDWCKEHDRPESQCFACHPEYEAKFAAQYEAKYGKQPPKPEGDRVAHEHGHEPARGRVAVPRDASRTRKLAMLRFVVVITLAADAGLFAPLRRAGAQAFLADEIVLISKGQREQEKARTNTHLGTTPGAGESPLGSPPGGGVSTLGERRRSTTSARLKSRDGRLAAPGGGAAFRPGGRHRLA